MNFYFLTLHPRLIEAFSKEGLIQKAVHRKHIQIQSIDLRSFGIGKHRRVDDKPYGGGPGMILRCEPIVNALRSLQPLRKSRVILFSARGKKFTQKTAKRLLKYENLVFICGRYEGVDQRISDYYADEELRIGDYVLMGGELAGCVVTESVSRLIPGVLGNVDSLSEESFSDHLRKEYPQYTRPPVFEGHKVPEVLLSGDHRHIEAWRKK